MPFPSGKTLATFALAVVSGGVLAACGPGTTSGEAGQAGSRTVSSGTAQLGGPFTLIDDKGVTVTEAEFEGTPTLLYFGFTYCPDVCPTALQK
ncbi:MAG: SCO family protein, partial [Pseudomonadota bacterium]